MAEEKKEAFLARWSRLKHEPPAKKEDETPAPSLPSVDKLTPESDFSGFMHPKVEDALRRVALKKLFSDPHFNVPDPYEPFSGDWIGGDPISEEMLAALNQAQTHLFSDQKQEEEKTETAAAAPPEKTDSKPDSNEPGKQDA